MTPKDLMNSGRIHCSGCGQVNPLNSEGYTTCCNKRICYGVDHLSGGYIGGSYGDGLENYGTPELSVRACCWGIAGKLFEEKGLRPLPGSCCF